MKEYLGNNTQIMFIGKENLKVTTVVEKIKKIIELIFRY